LGGKLFSPSQWQSQFKVGLGLDLSSGTQVTLQAKTLSGKPPSSDAMNAADSVILSRVNGTGNSGAQVQPEGTNLLVVTLPGAAVPALQRDQHDPGRLGERQPIGQRQSLAERDFRCEGERDPQRQQHG